MKRKILSIILALVTVSALIPAIITVSAADATTAANGEYVKISVGEINSYGIKTDGSLWAWGNNGGGQFGNGKRADISPPAKIMDDVASVSTNSSTTLAIKTDGTLWGWGAMVGDGTEEWRTAPVKIMDGVASASVGGFSLAVKKDGTLWVWGKNMYYGLLGIGTYEDKLTPVKIMDGVVSAAAGGNYGCAVKTDGYVRFINFKHTMNKLEAINHRQAGN